MIMLMGGAAFALEIAYPSRTMLTINSDSTFFIGSSTPGETVTVNDQPVFMSLEGAFAYTVELKPGRNIFNIKSGDKTLTYIITRPASAPITGAKAAFSPFAQPIKVAVSTDAAPMRSTPVDAGINRLSHFQKGVLLNIDGEQGDFFRVSLNDNTKAWIYRGNVSTAGVNVSENITSPQGSVKEGAVTIKKPTYSEDDNFEIYTFDLCNKIPYVITEGTPLKLNFYGPDAGFEFPVDHKLVGYSGNYEGNKFVLKIRKALAIDKVCPLKGVKISVDPGHGGYESGAVGCFKDKEKDINLAISKYLNEELALRGAEVYMTRCTDCYLGLKERVVASNKENASILLSIHNNAVPDNLNPLDYRGTSIYYYYPQAKPLAESLMKSMTTQLKTKNDGVRQGSLALVRNTEALSLLIEVGYMINPYDMELLRDANFQKQTAKAIADGIEDWVKNSK